MDPKPFTLYQLLIMRDAKEHSEWDKAALICTVATQMMGGKSNIVDFHPYLSKPRSIDNTEFRKIKQSLMARPAKKRKKPWEV